MLIKENGTQEQVSTKWRIGRLSTETWLGCLNCKQFLFHLVKIPLNLSCYITSRLCISSFTSFIITQEEQEVSKCLLSYLATQNKGIQIVSSQAIKFELLASYGCQDWTQVAHQQPPVLSQSAHTTLSYTTRNSDGLSFCLQQGGKYLVFVSSRSVKMRGFSFLSLYNF